MFGKLFIVATPIGNLEDITLRAINILCDVDVILAEDTRVTNKLLDFIKSKNHFIKANLISYHQHSDETKKFEILKLLLDGKNIALVTDAGTPGISDPGNELIDFIYQKEPTIRIIPIPGSSAITTALSVCGFRTNNFVFLGFLPKKGNIKLFQWLKEGKMTFAFYESPHRILKTLNTLEKEFGNPRVVVARELTKIFETIYRGKVSEVADKLRENVVKGEIVVVVEL